MIELKDISKIYGKNNTKVEALKNINLEIKKGELVAIVGTSGSGKSTLLNILGCLDSATEGQYYFDGKSITEYNQKELALLRNQKFGFVMQDFALVSDYTVYQNVEIPLIYGKVKRKKEIIENILTKLGINDKKDVLVTKLSGGQKQRVAIARALVNSPEIILADEPTGALDTATGQMVMDILTKINETGKIVIIVTHDMNIAKQCNKIFEICDGRIKCIKG